MGLGDLSLPTIVQTFRAQVSGISDVESDMSGAASSMSASLSSVASSITKYVTLPLIGAAGAALDMAAKFTTAFEKIHTQAGVPQADLASLKTGVLNLAGQVDASPDSLTEALYHVESSFGSMGISGKKALTMLKVAAEGARMSGATLTDVQNALDAAIVSGISGVQTYKQAMGALNAIVGSGDMQMQTLANAMGTGILASAKVAGMALATVGAALATFGDNNIRGAKAATELRMVMGMITAPSAAASKSMQELGLTTTQLAQDLRKPDGLLVALQTLKTHLNTPITGSQFVSSVGTALKKLASAGLPKTLATQWVKQYGANAAAAAATLIKMGLSKKTVESMLSKTGPNATDQAYMLGKIFGGGRTSGSLLVLLSQLTRLKSKYTDIDKSAKNFTNDWAKVKQQFSFQIGAMGKEVESFGIKFGLSIMPAAKDVLGEVIKIGGDIEKAPKGLKEFVIGGGLALAALAPIFLVTKKIVGAVQDVGKAAKTMWKGLTKFNTWVTKISQSMVKQKAVQEESTAATEAQTAAQEEENVAATEGAEANTALDASLDADPILLIVEALILLGGAIYEAYEHCKPFRDALDDVGHFFDSVGHDILNWAIDFKNYMVDAFDWVTDHWKLIAGILLAPIAPIIAAFVYFHSTVMGIFEDIYNFIADVWIVQFDVVKDVFLDVVGVVEDVVVPVFDAFKDAVMFAIDVVVTGFEMFWHLLQDVFGWVSDSWGTISTILFGPIEFLIGEVTKLPGQIEDVFKDAITWLVDAGKDIIEGLWHGIKDMAHTAVDAVKDVGHDIVSGFKDVLSIFSPSQVMYQAGVTTMKGATQGISDEGQNTVQAASNAAKQIVDAFGSVTKMDKDQKVLKSIKTMFSTLKTALSGLASLQSKVDAINFTAVSAAIKKFTATVPKLAPAISQLSSALSKLKDATKAKAQVKTMSQVFKDMTTVLGSLQKIVGQVGAMTMGKITTAFSKLAGELTTLAPAIEEMKKTFAKFGSDSSLTTFATRTKDLSKAFKDLDTAMKSLSATTKLVGSLNFGAIVTALDELTAEFVAITPAIKRIEDTFKKLDGNNQLTTFGTQLEALKKDFQDFSSAAKTMVDAGKKLAAMNLGAIATGLDELTAEMRAITPTMKSIEKDVNSMDKGGAFTKLAKQFETLKTAMGDFATGADSMVKAAKKLSSLNLGALATGLDELTAEMIAIAPSIKNLEKTFDSLNKGGALKKLTKDLTSLEAAMDSLSGVFSSVAATVLSIAGAELPNEFQTLDSAVTTMVSGMKTMWATLETVTKLHWNNVATFVKSIEKTVLSPLQDLSTKVTTVAKQLKKSWTKIDHDVRATWAYVETFLTTVPQKLIAPFTGIETTFTTIGKQIAQGLANGISDRTSAAVQAAVNLVTKAVTAAKDAATIHSPSRLTAETLGWPMAEGAAVGVDEKAYLLKESLAKAVYQAESLKVQASTAGGLAVPDLSLPSMAAPGGGGGGGNGLTSQVTFHPGAINLTIGGSNATPAQIGSALQTAIEQALAKHEMDVVNLLAAL